MTPRLFWVLQRGNGMLLLKSVYEFAERRRSNSLCRSHCINLAGYPHKYALNQTCNIKIQFIAHLLNNAAWLHWDWLHIYSNGDPSAFSLTDIKLLLWIITPQMRHTWYQSDRAAQTPPCKLNIYKSHCISGTGPFHHWAVMRSVCSLIINKLFKSFRARCKCYQLSVWVILQS